MDQIIRTRFQSRPKSLIRIQFQCMWIHNTAFDIHSLCKPVVGSRFTTKYLYQVAERLRLGHHRSLWQFPRLLSCPLPRPRIPPLHCRGGRAQREPIPTGLVSPCSTCQRTRPFSDEHLNPVTVPWPGVPGRDEAGQGRFQDPYSLWEVARPSLT